MINGNEFADWTTMKEDLDYSHTSGYDLGITGAEYVDPFEYIPNLCANKDSLIDRVIGLMFDRGYLQGYGEYTLKNENAVISLSAMRVKEKIELCDRARALGAEAYLSGRGVVDQIIGDVYHLLPRTNHPYNKSIYDSWNEGFLTNKKAYEDAVHPVEKNAFEKKPVFDYDRAYSLIEAVEKREEPQDENVVTKKAYWAMCSVVDLLNATEDGVYISCLVCPNWRVGDKEGCEYELDCEGSCNDLESRFPYEWEVIRAFLEHREKE